LSIKLIHDDLKNVLFGGLHKIISCISKALNKEIESNIKGDEVFIDFKISTMIKDSITHIIQNSADHGIEKKGLILINIEKTESHIHIDVSDNGKGIDPLTIRKRAIHKGIVSAEDVENNSKKDDLNLIFLPRF
jgi:two-component system chemotaxis sensor kinase CheA